MHDDTRALVSSQSKKSEDTAATITALRQYVTDLEQDVQNFQQMVDELRAIVHCFPEAVMVVKDTTIKIANEHLCTLLGLPTLNEIDRDLEQLFELVHKRSASDGRSLMFEDTSIAQALRGEAASSEVMIRNMHTGADHILRLSAAPIFLHGVVTGVVALYIDVTEQRRNEQRHTLLADVMTALNTALDVKTRLLNLARMMVPGLCDLCAIYVPTERNTLETLVLAHHEPAREARAFEELMHYPIQLDGPHPVARALQSSQIVCHTTVSDDLLHAIASNEDHLEFLYSLDISSMLSVPLIARSQTIGILHLIMDGSKRHFVAHSEELAEMIAQRAAIVVDNARLLEQEQHTRRALEVSLNRLGRLQRTTAALAEELSLDDVANIIMAQGVAALEARAGAIMLSNAERTHLHLLRWIGFEDAHMTQWQQLSLDVNLPATTTMRTKQPVWIESRAMAQERYPRLLEAAQRNPDHRAWCSLPLRRLDEVVGVLLLSFGEEQVFTQADQEFMQALAYQCSLALDRAYRYEAEQQARAKAEEALSQRDQMVSLISHDLKSPLAAIQGYAQLLQRRVERSDVPDGARWLRNLDSIAATTTRVSAQIEELLDVASIQSGRKLNLTYGPADLLNLVTRVVEACQFISRQHTIAIETALTSLPCMVDTMRLERVLTNLISNAIKYSPEGGSVHIRLVHDAVEGQECARIEVHDTGLGIPADDLPHVFEPFYRARNVQSQIGGTGLGLANARHIIEQHGGTISVSSTLDKGTTFTLFLPVRAAS